MFKRAYLVLIACLFALSFILACGGEEGADTPADDPVEDSIADADDQASVDDDQGVVTDPDAMESDSEDDPGTDPGTDISVDRDVSGTDTEGDTTPVVPEAGLAVISTPPTLALVGETYRYRVRSSGVGDHVFGLLERPEAMTVSTEGEVGWTPTFADTGAHEIVVQVAIGDEEATQAYTLNVDLVTPVAVASVGTSGGRVAYVDLTDPRNHAAVVIPDEALDEGVLIEIGTLNNPLEARGFVAFEGVDPMVLGPTGLTFRTPVTVYLPIADSVLGDDRTVAALVLQEETGVWEPATILDVDLSRNIMVVQADHFSTYVPGWYPWKVDVTLVESSEADDCVHSLGAQAFLNTPLSDVRERTQSPYRSLTASTRPSRGPPESSSPMAPPATTSTVTATRPRERSPTVTTWTAS